MKSKGSMASIGKITLSIDISDESSIQHLSTNSDAVVKGRVQINNSKEGDISFTPIIIGKMDDEMAKVPKEYFQKSSTKHPLFRALGFLFEAALGNAYMLIATMKTNPSQLITVIYFKSLNFSIYTLHNEGDEDIEKMKDSMRGFSLN